MRVSNESSTSEQPVTSTAIRKREAWDRSVHGEAMRVGRMTKRTRRKAADKPPTVEELRALHRSAAYQKMIARVREAERERSERLRRPLMPTIANVLSKLTLK
jgi:hypothetical protein